MYYARPKNDYLPWDKVVQNRFKPVQNWFKPVQNWFSDFWPIQNQNQNQMAGGEPEPEPNQNRSSVQLVLVLWTGSELNFGIPREAEKENECPTAGQGPGNGIAIPVQMKDLQSKFRCKVKQEGITARSNLGPTFQRFSIIKERLAHHMEIDCNEIYADMPGPQAESAPPEQDNNQDQDARAEWLAGLHGD
ncbi:hypothetical protein BYT27DRAFT_7207418 [Phlegmacium glaucopus]|nr:hypothetical protein BYT27DRAFT_7207418 [Phlegmacium glaucopus]